MIPKTEESGENQQLVYSADVCRDHRISQRCLRKWLAKGRFPRPDGNLHGRNFWLRSTYRSWQVDVRAGKFARVSNLARKIR